MASSLSNEELRRALLDLGENCGPVTDTTRNVYLKRLAKLKPDAAGVPKSPGRGRPPKNSTAKKAAPKSTKSQPETDEESSPVRSVRPPSFSSAKKLAPAPKAAPTPTGAIGSPRKGANKSLLSESGKKRGAILFDYSDADHSAGDDDLEEYSVADASANTSFAFGANDSRHGARMPGAGASYAPRNNDPSPLRARKPITSPRNFVPSYGTSHLDRGPVSSPYSQPIASSTPTELYRTDSTFKGRTSSTLTSNATYKREYATAGYGSKEYGSTAYGSKDYGSTAYGSKDYCSKDYGSKDYGSMDYGSKDYGSVDYGSKDYGSVGYGSSDYGRPVSAGRYAIARQADDSALGKVLAKVYKWRQDLMAAFRKQVGLDKRPAPSAYKYQPYRRQPAYARPQPAETDFRDWLCTVPWDYAGKILALALTLIFCAYFLTVNRQKALVTGKIVYHAASDTVEVVYRRMILPILAVLALCGICLAVYFLRKRSIENRLKHRRAVFDMVEQITSVLRDHCRTAVGQEDPYLPVPHIRDMIIKPADRSSKKSIWAAAVRYMNEEESRVSTETKLVHGRECMVWRWLHPDSVAVENVPPFTLLQNQQTSDNYVSERTRPGRLPSEDEQNDLSDDDNLAHDERTPGRLPILKDKIWQGHALSGDDDCEPTSGAKANAPTKAPSMCLKLRGLFNPLAERRSDWPQHVTDALLERIGPQITVYHVAVDKSSKEGVVYMRLSDLEGALSAFRVLNGSWFAGNMVRAKFVRDERYSERFPESDQASLPLSPTRPRHSLLK